MRKPTAIRDAATDAELLAATAVSAAAFAAFYRRYEARVLGYMLARVEDPELAADLTSEVFARILENAERYEPDRAGPSAASWVFAIAHNALVSALRRRHVAMDARQRLGMSTPLALDDETFERVEALADIAPDALSELRDLPEAQRAAIVAHVLEERPYAEIAAELRCSPLVVRKRVSRGLAALRARVEETA